MHGSRMIARMRPMLSWTAYAIASHGNGRRISNGSNAHSAHWRQHDTHCFMEQCLEGSAAPRDRSSSYAQTDPRYDSNERDYDDHHAGTAFDRRSRRTGGERVGSNRWPRCDPQALPICRFQRRLQFHDARCAESGTDESPPGMVQQLECGRCDAIDARCERSDHARRDARAFHRQGRAYRQLSSGLCRALPTPRRGARRRHGMQYNGAANLTAF